jgi:hypothetical protein
MRFCFWRLLYREHERGEIGQRPFQEIPLITDSKSASRERFGLRGIYYASIERSILENQAALETLLPGAFFRTFSHPISPPRPQTKRMVGRRFACARGGGQTLNIS